MYNPDEEYDDIDVVIGDNDKTYRIQKTEAGKYGKEKKANLRDSDKAILQLVTVSSMVEDDAPEYNELKKYSEYISDLPTYEEVVGPDPRYKGTLNVRIH